MAKTLKTYPDGSEFTTTHVAALAAFSIGWVAVCTGFVGWRDHRRNRKMMDKAVKTLKNED